MYHSSRGAWRWWKRGQVCSIGIFLRSHDIRTKTRRVPHKERTRRQHDATRRCDWLQARREGKWHDHILDVAITIRFSCVPRENVNQWASEPANRLPACLFASDPVCRHLAFSHNINFVHRPATPRRILFNHTLLRTLPSPFLSASSHSTR